MTDEKQPTGGSRDELVEDDEEARGNWTSKLDFLLSCLGFAVGLGNVWRFPYLCYDNGGGAFLIPYVIFLCLAGIPLFFMELGIGQFSSLGPVAAFSHLCPILKGIGTGMVTISGITCVYYNMIIAWTIFYTFASFNKVLPWSNCDFERSTLDCYDYNLARKCESGGGIFYKTYCFNATEATEYRVTKEMAANATKVFPSQEYFTNYVLDMTDGIEYMGKQRWQLVLCLLAAWVIVYLCLIKGVKSSGKVVYFTALFPYVVLTILLIRGATMPGAINGIRFYMIPDWSKLKHAKVWGDAAKQIFYSLGPAWGGLITLASYNKFNNNLYRDALIVSVGNCATSVFAGFAIFSILGFMAHDINVPVGEVVDSGPGLAFIAYPEAITRLPIAPLWSFLFFFMIITLGLDSQFTMMETVTTAVLDKFTQLRKYKAWVLLAACTLWFLAGLSMTGQVGVYVLTLIDSYAAGWSLMILALLECIVIGWFYDVPNVKSPRTRRFGDDIAMMIGYRPFIGWQIMWKFVTPAILLFILFFTWIDYTPIKYASYVYPPWANGIGWMLALLSVIQVPIFAAITVATKPAGMSVFQLFMATEEWAPAETLAKRKMSHVNEMKANAAPTYLNPAGPHYYKDQDSDLPPAYSNEFESHM